MAAAAPESEAESSSMASSASQQTRRTMMYHQSKALLRRFLEYTDPSLLSEDGTLLQLDTPITEWDILYSTPSYANASTERIISPSIIVRSHPSSEKNLFSVQSVVPGIDARQFWSLMANSTNRHLWDSTVELSNVQWWIAEEIRRDEGLDKDTREEYERVARKLSARIELMRFGSIMFVANKRDMVLLSIDTQLPSSDGKLRLLSTSTSIDDPRIPLKKGYNRFQLQTGGFLVEDLGNPKGINAPKDSIGIRVTQISDLGEMASWVPASIIKMVASTMVPRSVNAITKVASKMQVPEALFQDFAGYSGEGEVEQEKEKLSESGGTWQRRRPLPPIWTKSDSCLEEESGNSSFDNNTAASESSTSSASMPNTPSEEENISLQSSSSRIVESLTLQHLSTSIPGQAGPTDTALQEEEGSQSGDSHSIATSSAHSRITFGLDSGTETIPGSPRSLMKSEEDLVEELIDDEEDLTLYRSDDQISSEKEGEEEEAAGMTMEGEDEKVGDLFSKVDAQRCSQFLSRHTRTLSRMSESQRETQKRISIMLVQGSDAIAMAIAPGARDSMASVARIMDASISSLQEDLEREEEEEEEDQKPDQDPHPSQTFRRRLGSSTAAPPATTTAYVGGKMDASRSSSNVISSHVLSSSASSSTTLCDEGKCHPIRMASSASWTSSITEAPYTLALSILHLATWAASRPISSLSSSLVVKEEEEGGGGGEEGERAGSAETIQPTRSALSVTRMAYSQRNAMRVKAKERPRSHYRVDDSKLHPFPRLVNENLPPVGIASGAPAKFMDCDIAKMPLQEPVQQRGGWWGSYW